MDFHQYEYKVPLCQNRTVYKFNKHVCRVACGLCNVILIYMKICNK